jgi:hypothetical protein
MVVSRGLLLTILVLILGAPLSAQDSVNLLIVGRLEDAATRQPVRDARVFAADSSAVTVSDSLGHFELLLSRTSPAAVHVERLGYIRQSFDLRGDPQSQRYVLLLEPAPIEIEGITAEAEAALSELVTNLEARRNAYPHAMRAFDRTWIDRFGPTGGSAYDLVHQKLPGLTECRSDPTQLCVPGRARTFRNPYPQRQITVCIDSWRALAPASDLSSLAIGSVSLVELYQRDAVRVYTVGYLLSQARTGRTNVLPLWMGC